jgi:hypothetical protein
MHRARIPTVETAGSDARLLAGTTVDGNGQRDRME